MNDNPIKKLPFALEAEQSVLGSILIDPESFTYIADIVSGEDFYLEEHRQIFDAMKRLFIQNREIDIVTLIDTLVKEGVYDEAGGTQYIRLIAEVVPSAANIRDYANIVKDKSTLRRLIEVCEEITGIAYSEQGAVEYVLDSAEQKIFAIAEKRETKSFDHIRNIMLRVYEQLELLSRDKGAARGTPTGFSSVDRLLVGLGKGDLVLVGARPGMGKTSFCMNIATNVAKQTKKAVCVFSLEMSAEQLVSRMLSSEALVDSYSLRSGSIAEEDWAKLAHAAAELSDTDILVDDTTGITITGMKAKLRRVKNLGLVIIDYLQLMQSDRRIDNRVQEVADISRNLKIMAKELAVPVICCAQLSRGPESRSDKKPMLSDLRDSGAIEQDADIVMFLYRSEYYKSDDNSAHEQDANVAEVIIAKNRHGSTGTVKMGWICQYTKFLSIDDNYQGG
ncbi:MAG: replicative DNA helicase [Clostridiales bacterium]|nr:replicative DNA helicase [Clostridiales bacterium]